MSGRTDLNSLRVQLSYIYNTYRTALLNRKYYGEKLSDFQTRNFYMEIMIAVGATGSGGVAGLAVWGTLTGKYAWLAISAVATLLSVVKPVLQFGKQIEKYTKLYAGYTAIYLDLKAIVEDVDKARAVTKKIEERYEVIRKLVKDLGSLDDPRQDENLIRRLQTKVNEEIPPESLWVP